VLVKYSFRIRRDCYVLPAVVFTDAITRGVFDGYSVFNHLQEFRGHGNRGYMARPRVRRMGYFHSSRYALFYGTRGDRLFSEQVRPGNGHAVANVPIDGTGRDGVRAKFLFVFVDHDFITHLLSLRSQNEAREVY
jgi:hypothetical protein